jgi:hypothetical protein
MRFVFLGLVILSAAVSAQTAPVRPDPTALFQRVRARLLADAGRMPRYTCLQNITRHFYRTNSTEPQSCAAILAKRTQRKHDPPATSWDRLQLDVAIADDREIHSWPDAPKFNEDEIRKLVSNGPFGSGDFSAFVAGIFGGASTVTFEGQRTANERSLFEYTFAVANNASHYQIATSGANLITAYDGSFLLDPQSADLVQLSVHTAELPEATNACQAISEIEYGRIDIHGHQVLIPHETNLRIVYRSGREAVATTSYSICHEYTSKAILRFDAEPVALSAASRPALPAANTPPASPFPAGLTFNCRIVTPIDSETPAGRPIEAILRSPLHGKGKDKAILAPSGAHIHGRLVRLADHKSTLDYFEVGVRLESIEVNAAELPLYATLESQEAPPVNPFAGPVNAFAGDDRAEQLADFPTAPPRNVGVFFFVREKLRLPQFDSAWITTSSDTEKESAAAPAGQQNQTALPEKTKQQIAETETQPAPPPASSLPPSKTAAQDEISQDPAPQNETPAQPAATQNAPAPNPETPAPAGTPADGSVPQGIAISAELAKSVDARKSKVGDEVEAKSTVDLLLPDKTALPRETKIIGHVSNAKARSKDSPGSMVEIIFDRVLLKDGRQLPLQASLQAIGQPLPRAPAPMDNSIVSPGAGTPAAGSASGAPPQRGSPGPPPTEPPQVSNPDSGAEMPGEHNPDALNADSQGVFGLKGLSLGTARNASVISSGKGNVHLEKGTQLILRTQ